MLITYNSNLIKFFILQKYIFNYLDGKLFNSTILYVIQMLIQTQLNLYLKMFDNIIEGKLFNSIIFYVIQLLFTHNSNSTKFFDNII